METKSNAKETLDVIENYKLKKHILFIPKEEIFPENLFDDKFSEAKDDIMCCRYNFGLMFFSGSRAKEHHMGHIEGNIWQNFTGSGDRTEFWKYVSFGKLFANNFIGKDASHAYKAALYVDGIFYKNFYIESHEDNEVRYWSEIVDTSFTISFHYHIY